MRELSEFDKFLASKNIGDEAEIVPLLWEAWGKAVASANRVHRPWPKGKTEKQMLGRVAVAAGVVSGRVQFCGPEDIREAIVELHEALDAYELGKPLEKS